MNVHVRRWFLVASVSVFTLCAPRIGASVDRLIWRASGAIQSITASSLTVDRFTYSLTPTTAYEKNHHQTTRSAFSVGDRVKVTFLTDRSVLRLEEDTSRGNIPSGTPIPGATSHSSRFSAKLAPLGASTSRGNSVGSYNETEGRFTLNIKVPRNTIPLATTDEEAKALSVNAVITRRGAVVARCSTSFAVKRQKLSVYEFKTDIERKSDNGASTVRARKGRCTLPSGSIGIPTVRSGDRVTVSEKTAGEFLKGHF